MKAFNDKDMTELLNNTIKWIDLLIELQKDYGTVHLLVDSAENKKTALKEAIYFMEGE